MFGKRGLSDVVSTVLIILLVVAAVAAVWVFIQPTLKNAGDAVEKGTVCLTSTVEPIACVAGVAVSENTPYTISYTRETDEKVDSLSSVRMTLELDDGSVVSGNGNANLANGGSATSTLNAGGSAKQVSITSEFNLADGQKQTCTSIAFTCTE